jgi:uncharacterized membrane protein
MKPGELISNLDEGRIAGAIARAERGTSGEIRVCVSHHPRPDPLAAAERRFHKLGMGATRHRNAVLLYFVPLTRQFAVWGDTGVHERCGDDFWKSVVAAMTPLLQAGQYTDAILRGVEEVGSLLARHFPPDPGDRNELPNRVAGD